MQQNPLSLVIAIASLAVTGLCCVGGMAFAGFMTYRTTSYAGPPPYTPPATAYAPPPAYAPPAIPVPERSVAPGAPASLAILPGTPTRGPEAAPITIHIVSDYQCPFCSRVEPTLTQLDGQNPGRIRWVWHDYPLPFHQNAMPAAEAAREVQRQLGDAAFWRFHDMLFENNRDLSAATIERLAGAMPGLDMGAFRSALASHQHEPAIRADMAQVTAATTSGSVGTPCFLINGQWLRGAQPLSAFQTAFDQASPR